VTTALTEIRPHLARAALLASRLKFEQIKSTVDAMEALGIWAAALKNGRLVVANQSFQRLIPSVMRDGRHRLAIVQKAADARWASLLDGSATTYGGSFPIAAREEQPAMVVHALPVAGAANDMFNAADLILAITPMRKEAKVDDGILAALYDLTPAEAFVAREIGLGRSVDEVAKSREVSVGTIRTQLHSVFDKTGSKRQAELAGLVLGLVKHSD
jgi:DNA-binding CsgD family transcriptional regulator